VLCLLFSVTVYACVCVSCLFASKSCHCNVRLLPDRLQGVFSSNGVVCAQKCLDKVKALWKAALKVQRLSAAPHGCPTEFQNILSCVFWLRQPLVQLLMGVCDSGEWHVRDQRIRDVLWKLFTGCWDTKGPNENVFNALQDETRSNKNGVISDWRAWHCGATCGGITDTTGCELLHVPAEDYKIQASDIMPSSGVPTGSKFFNKPANHKCSIDVSRVTSAKDRNDFQKTGLKASREVVSATDTLELYSSRILDDSFPQNARDVQQTWRSQVFVEGLVFVRISDGVPFVSLGASTWSFLASRLTRAVVDDTLYLSVFCGPASCAERVNTITQQQQETTQLQQHNND
jgi:hypothetical protein